MSNPEDELRRRLHDPAWSLPAWGDAPGVLERAVRRRRRRVWGISGVVVALGAVAALLAVFSFVGVPQGAERIHVIGPPAAAQGPLPAPPPSRVTNSPAGPSPSLMPSPPVTPTPTQALGVPPAAIIAPPSLPPAGEAPAAYSITFISVSDAWVLAQGPGAGPVVLHSTTRGQHWSQVGALPARAGGGGVTGIRFADAMDGWAFGPQLYATHDGGATWHAVAVPGDVVSLEAFDGVAWAVISPCTAPSIGACVQSDDGLFRASAASDGWQAVGPQIQQPGGILALHDHAVYVTSAPGFVYSPDGQAFSTEPSPCPSGANLSGLAVASAVDVSAICASDPGAGSSTKQVLVSSDAGQTWSAIAPAPRGGQPGGLAMGSPSTIALSATSGADWVYVSNAAGTAWTTSLQLSEGGQGWADLGFTDATHGVVIHAPPTAGLASGQGAVYLTDNAGATWYQVTL